MARYIDADRIEYTARYVGTDEFAGFQTIAYKSEIDEIPTADVVPKSEWISAEERLPKVATKVLVTDGKYVSLGYVLNMGDSGLCPWVVQQPVFHRDVTHWMPLPEPPKMKGGE